MPKSTAAKPPIRPIRSVAEFIGVVLALRGDPNVTYAFRGMRNAAWETEPGIMRRGQERLLQHESEAVFFVLVDNCFRRLFACMNR